MAPDGQYGRKDTKTGKWNGLIGSLINETIDIAIAGLTSTSERLKYTDMLRPLMKMT